MSVTHGSVGSLHDQYHGRPKIISISRTGTKKNKLYKSCCTEWTLELSKLSVQ